MTLVVDISHWLGEHGELPTTDRRLRRHALRIAHFIEYGGPLEPLQARETLIECRRRPAHQPCLGLLWVMKRPDEGVMPAAPMTDDRAEPGHR